MGLSTFAWSDASYYLGAVLDCFLGMESAMGTSDTLADHSSVSVDENACGCAKGPSHIYGYAGLGLRERCGCYFGNWKNGNGKKDVIIA